MTLKGSINSVPQKSSPVLSEYVLVIDSNDPLLFSTPQSSHDRVATHTTLSEANYNIKQPVLQAPLIISKDVYHETAVENLDEAWSQVANHLPFHVTAASSKKGKYKQCSVQKIYIYPKSSRIQHVISDYVTSQEFTPLVGSDKSTNYVQLHGYFHFLFSLYST